MHHVEGLPIGQVGVDIDDDNFVNNAAKLEGKTR